MQLHEQYRPKAFKDVVGQSRAIKKITTLERRGLAGRSYWIEGKSGTGKTTIGNLIADTVADDFTTFNIDSSTCTMKTIQDICRKFSFRTLTANGYAVVVNESHGLRKDVIRHLLDVLEDVPDNVVWVFTTTCDGHDSLFGDDHIDAHPLLSRCQVIGLQKNVRTAFAKRAKEIAEKEGLGGKGLVAYEQLAAREKDNLRSMLQHIEAGDMLSDDGDEDVMAMFS
jgi:replication-associated recombination protein RarA